MVPCRGQPHRSNLLGRDREDVCSDLRHKRRARDNFRSSPTHNVLSPSTANPVHSRRRCRSPECKSQTRCSSFRSDSCHPCIPNKCHPVPRGCTTRMGLSNPRCFDTEPEWVLLRRVPDLHHRHRFQRRSLRRLQQHRSPHHPQRPRPHPLKKHRLKKHPSPRHRLAPSRESPRPPQNRDWSTRPPWVDSSHHHTRAQNMSATPKFSRQDSSSPGLAFARLCKALNSSRK